MTAGGPSPGPIRDPALLRGALSRLNDARLAPENSSARLASVLSGFEELVVALAGEHRGPGAACALEELEALLGEPGAETGAAALRGYLEPILARLIEALLDHPERRLAAYGSLLPGENNHHHMEQLVGRWVEGTVEGTLHDRGWAARQGYPGFVPGSSGDRVEVKVFESLSLPDAWERLDAFEGAAYRRILAPVEMRAETKMETEAEMETVWRVCNIYELTDLPPRSGRASVSGPA